MTFARTPFAAQGCSRPYVYVFCPDSDDDVEMFDAFEPEVPVPELDILGAIKTLLAMIIRQLLLQRGVL